jgi:hypothetical protein
VIAGIRRPNAADMRAQGRAEMRLLFNFDGLSFHKKLLALAFMPARK